MQEAVALRPRGWRLRTGAELFGLFGDRVVAEVAEDVVKVARLVVLGTEAEVAFVVVPNGQRVPVGHKYPLPDVKLSAAHKEWPLDVLLRHQLLRLAVLARVSTHLHTQQNPLVATSFETEPDCIPLIVLW